MAQRALRDTEIVSMSKEELVAAVGPLLSNTKLLVDAIGNRVMLLVSDAFSDQAYIAIKTLVDRDNNALPARQSSQTTAIAARGRSSIRTDRTLSKSILKLCGLGVIATLSLAPSGAKASAFAASPCEDIGHGCILCNATDEEGNACKVWFCGSRAGFECEE